MDHDFASEILHRRVLSPESGNPNANSTNSLCSPAEESTNGLRTLSSANLRAHINARSPSNSSNIEVRASRKRGWKVQGQIAGEWRDRLGRRRRARPMENANTNAIAPAASGYAAAAAADMSMVSSIPESSCGGTEVSFEGLVDELRERLPHASLLAELVATQQKKNAHHMCPGVEAMVTGTIATIDQQQEEMARTRRDDGGDGGGGGGSGNIRHTAGGGAQGAPPPISGGTATRICTISGSSSTEPQRGGAAPEVMPGCLRLRYPMIGTMRAPTNPQPLMRSVPAGGSTSNLRLNSAVGTGPQPSLLLPPGGTFFSDGSTYRLVTTGAMETSDDVSPSAAMVAAGRAHERALPLLQVCAVKVVGPTGV